MLTEKLEYMFSWNVGMVVGICVGFHVGIMFALTLMC